MKTWLVKFGFIDDSKLHRLLYKVEVKAEFRCEAIRLSSGASWDKKWEKIPYQFWVDAIEIKDKMEPNITQIKELRNCTGCSPSDAKKALQLNSCDLSKSIEYLRKQGIVKTKLDIKPTTQGLIAIGVSSDAVAMLEVLTETDFTAMNEFVITRVKELATWMAEARPLAMDDLDDLIKRTGENIVFGRHFFMREDPKSFGTYLHSDSKLGVVVEFNKDVNSEFGKDIAMHIAATNPLAVSRENISQAFLEKETEIFKENAAKSGKPLVIIEKIVAGQINALVKEKSLEDQLFVKDTKKTIKQLLNENGVKVNAFARWRVGLYLQN